MKRDRRSGRAGLGRTPCPLETSAISQGCVPRYMPFYDPQSASVLRTDIVAPARNRLATGRIRRVEERAPRWCRRMRAGSNSRKHRGAYFVSAAVLAEEAIRVGQLAPEPGLWCRRACPVACGHRALCRVVAQPSGRWSTVAPSGGSYGVEGLTSRFRLFMLVIC